MDAIAIIVSLTLFAAALMHFYWAWGGTYGIDKAVPAIDGRPAFLPGPWLTLFVAVSLLAISATALLLRWLPASSAPWLDEFGFLLAALFLLRAIGDFKLVGFFKRVDEGDFALFDTKYYSPLCVVLGVAFAALSYLKG
jgi:hypothetical protein